MSYTPVPAVAAGDWIDEVFINTYWVDNMAAGVPDVFTAKGQLAVGTGVDSMGVLSVGMDNSVLHADSTQASGLIWKNVEKIYRRQGNSATDWNVTGTVTYTPASTQNMQLGAVNIPNINTAFNTWYYGDATVTFPVAYTNKPLIFCTYINLVANSIMGIIATSITISGFTVRAIANATSANQNVAWLAIGQ